MSKRIKGFLFGTIVVICGVVMLCCALTVPAAYIYRYGRVQVVGCGVIFLLISIMLYAFIKKYESHLTSRRVNIIFFTLLALLLAVQIVYVTHLKYYPKIIDPKIIHVYVKHYVLYGNFDNVNPDWKLYMSKYPNVWGIVYFMIPYYELYYKITGEITIQAGVYLNVIIIQASLIFTFLTEKLIFKSKASQLFCGLILLAMPVNILYIPFFHSDTVGMMFISIAAYLFVRLLKAKSSGARIAFAVAFALVTGAGNTIKGTLVIIMIAAAIIVIFKYPLKTSAVFVALVLVSFFGTQSISKSVGLEIGMVSEQQLEENEFPIAHWLMMGLCDHGGHSFDDVAYTLSFKGKQAKKEADVKLLKERISKLGVSGMVRHVGMKVCQTWGKGEYNYRRLTSCVQMPQKMKTLIYSQAVSCYCRAYHLAMFAAMGACAVRVMKKRRKNAVSFSLITVSGLIMFLIIWENLERYTVSFIPLYMFTATAGIRYLYFAAKKSAGFLHTHSAKKAAS